MRLADRTRAIDGATPLDATPEDAVTAAGYRYPFGPYPTGWYLLTESASLSPGQVLPLHYFGRDLVLFRTESGQAVVADAHCPHMGAHLGVGGTVVGETIRCPFHAWRFGATGACEDVPYKTSPGLPDAGLTCWPVHETSGVILVHFSASGQAPTWLPPDQPMWGQDGWVGYETVAWTIRTHVQEIVENIPDTSHFHFVHGLPGIPKARVETDGPVYRQVMSSEMGGMEIDVLVQVAYGMGLAWLEVEQPRYRFLIAQTPIDADRVELRLLFLIDEGPGATEISDAGRSIIKLISRNTALDVNIWEHKVYRQRPPLVAGDGPIGLLRKWSKQFYEVPG